MLLMSNGIILPKEMEKALKDGLLEQRELSRYLIINYPVSVLADALSDFLLKADITAQPIPLSQEDYERVTSLFRIKGQRADGTVENRGKKKV